MNSCNIEDASFTFSRHSNSFDFMKGVYDFIEEYLADTVESYESGKMSFEEAKAGMDCANGICSVWKCTAYDLACNTAFTTVSELNMQDYSGGECSERRILCLTAGIALLPILPLSMRITGYNKTAGR